MVSNKMLRAACDGVATVGVSNLVSGLLADGTPASGMPYGTIGLPNDTVGRIIPGNRAYRRAHRKVSGVATGVMGQ